MGRTIRVFISSTFTQFDGVRNELVAKVFPKIQALCAKDGFTFRAVDLRWGITENEGRNHQTAAICFEEIRRCQEYSPQPNFIVLSDDYYGWIPVPASISAHCWQRIEEYLKGKDPGALAFLEKWYRKDLNDLSGHYILQDFRAGLEDENCTGEEGEKCAGLEGEEIQPLEEQVEQQIGNVLFPAAKAVFADEYSLRVAFGGSLTEQEINLGLFSKKGAEEHTLVMIREKKDGAGSTKCGTGAPEDGSAFNAHNLNEHLKKVMHKDSEETWISFDEKTYLDKAEKFLERVIKRQISKVKDEEKKETAFERECRELQESLSAEAGDYIDADGRLERLRCFSDEIRGKAGLVKGKQGSGKSTLLRYYVLNGQEQCAGVFADLQGGRATVDSALGFLAGVLQQRGLLEVMPPRYPGESSAGYFERQLEGLKKDAKVTLLMDCAENIPDFKLQEKSLFSMNLPAGVTLLVSCVDENSLSKTDLLYAPPVFEVRDVRKEEAFPMLLGMLEKYGRTLTGWQQEKIRRALPDEATPLYLRMLADLLRLIPGYNENCGRSGQYVFDRPLPENAYLLAQESLAREMQAYLPGLYRHLLACIVLSAQGMQEEELIGILLREVTEGSSLHAEILGNSHWNITSMEHVLNVFWSRMRFRLQSFLGTYPSYGNLLIRFRHGLMREAALAVISGTPDGQRADDPRTDILQETSLALRDFWMEQSPYLETKPEDPKAADNAASSALESAEAETEGEVHKVVVNAASSAPESTEAEKEGAVHKVIVNRRRADELYPILQYRGEIKTAGMLLEDPYYLDAMVRLDRCRTLMSQLESALGSGYAGIRAQAYLELLEEKEILLTSFTDSFLALCVQHGITGSDVLGRVCAAGYFLESGTLPRAAGGFSGQGAVAENGSPARRTPLRKGDPVDPVLHVPGCAEAPMALRSDGIMALMDRGNIRIYDWNRRQYSTARVPIRHKRSDFLYWKGDTLVLRRTKSRICFRFIKKGEGAEEELLPGQEESCPNLLDLFDDREERCRRAGDVAEEEAAGRRKDRRLFYHSRDGVRKLRMLEYPLETEIAYYLRLGQAAVVIDREKIDFVDLDAGTVRETMRVDNATGVYFSDDAGCVLICTRAENIILHRITDRNSHAMPVWEESPKERKKALRMHRLRDFFAPYVMFGPGRKRDLPWRPAGDAVYGSPSPALTCMSVDEGWFACYYYYRNIAVVRLFDLDSGTEILSSEVEPVYWNDMENPPMWAEDRGRKLVLRSLGICHVLDLTTEQPTWSTRREKTASTSTKKPDTAGKGKIEAAGTEKPDIASMKKSTAAKTEKPDTADMKDVLISDCRQHMWRWIPQGHVYETLEDLTNNSFDTAAGRFGARLWRLVFSPVTYVLMPEKVNNPKKVYLLQTIRTEKYLWLVDFLYRTIHIADADGHWLCHTQMKEAFAAADASENTLYLMSENRENIREIRYFSLSDPD